MLSCMKLQASNHAIKHLNNNNNSPGNNSHRWPSFIRAPRPLRFSSLSLKNSHETASSSASMPSISSSHFTSSVGFPPASLQWNLTPRHITLLHVVACAVAFSATWLFCSAIPTLLAFKRAAESLEKLLDVTREELPDTMAAVRLSGMEISDLTMELSDLGQEITQGVRGSTRAVRVAEERLRRLANMAPPGRDQVES